MHNNVGVYESVFTETLQKEMLIKRPNVYYVVHLAGKQNGPSPPYFKTNLSAQPLKTEGKGRYIREHCTCGSLASILYRQGAAKSCGAELWPNSSHFWNLSAHDAILRNSFLMEDTHMRAHTDAEWDTHLTCYDWISGLLLGRRGWKRKKNIRSPGSPVNQTTPPQQPWQTDAHRNWHGKKRTYPCIITSACFFTNFFAMVAPLRYKAAVSFLPLQNFFVQTTKANNTKLSWGLICCQKKTP